MRPRDPNFFIWLFNPVEFQVLKNEKERILKDPYDFPEGMITNYPYIIHIYIHNYPPLGILEIHPVSCLPQGMIIEIRRDSFRRLLEVPFGPYQRTPGPSKLRDRAIRYSGFFGVCETWVRPLEISWIRWIFFEFFFSHPPSPSFQAFFLQNVKKWCLVWIGKSKTTRMSSIK